MSPGLRPKNARRYRWGCVHGRFQPFHNEHLEYVIHAKLRCEQLVIGTTNPDPTWVRAEEESPHRHEVGSNPFTYLERVTMIRATLLGEGVSPREFLLVPFPIQDLGLYRYYVPEDACHFLRVYSEWEREKGRRIRAQGLNLEILDPEKEKTISGSDVRRLLRTNRPWAHLVPGGTANVIRRVLAVDPERLRAA